MAQIDVKAMLEDPVMQMGLGIMANKSPTFASQVGGGLQGALGNLQAMEQRNITNQLAAGKLALDARNDPTTKQKDYALYVQQAQAAGRTPVDFTTWDRANRQSGAINLGAGETSVRPLTKEEAVRYGYDPDQANRFHVNRQGDIKKNPELTTEGRKYDYFAATTQNAVEGISDVLNNETFNADFSGFDGYKRAGFLEAAYKGVPLAYGQLNEQEKILLEKMLEATRGMLRLESGAAIPLEEKDNWWTEFGIKGGMTPEDINRKVASLTKTASMQKGQSATPTTATASNKTYVIETDKGPVSYTDEDIKYTAEKNNMTEDQVRELLGTK